MHNNSSLCSYPCKLYTLSACFSPWLFTLAVILLFIGWGWGLGYAPADEKQQDAFRILYVHVPAAILSMSAYALMAVFAFIAFVWQNKVSELMMISIAPIGATFTFIALATGSIWGQAIWNTWWEWDPRLTSELILFFIYLGVIGLYQSFDNSQQAGKIVCLLVLLGAINLPIIHFSVEWWHSIHQSSTRMHHTINSAMRTPLRISILAYFLLLTSLALTRFQTLLLCNSQRQEWGIEGILIKGQP